MTKAPNEVHLTRRRFLIATVQLATAAALCSPLSCLGAPGKADKLSFYHTHTGETLKLDLLQKVSSQQTVKRLNHFLRDFRTGDIYPIDLRLLDILSRLKRLTNSKGTFEVISGYRSPATNAILRKQSSGVAQKSLHLKGRAIDIRLTDIRTKDLTKAARSLQVGGVGYYAASDFVHIDTGRVRNW